MSKKSIIQASLFSDIKGIEPESAAPIVIPSEYTSGYAFISFRDLSNARSSLNKSKEDKMLPDVLLGISTTFLGIGISGVIDGIHLEEQGDVLAILLLVGAIAIFIVYIVMRRSFSVDRTRTIDEALRWLPNLPVKEEVDDAVE